MRHTLAVAVALLLLAGCAKASGPDRNTPATPGTLGTDDAVMVTEVRVGDRLVTCVAWNRGYGGGLSCDWANTKPVSR